MDVAGEFFHGDLGHLGLWMHDGVKGADPLLGIDKYGAEVVLDGVFGVEALGLGNGFAGFETDLIRHEGPGKGFVARQPPPGVGLFDTNAFREGRQNGRGVHLRKDGERDKVDVGVVGKLIAQFEHLSCDSGAATGAAAVGVGEHDGLAFEVSEGAGFAHALGSGEGLGNLAEDG